MAFDVNDVLKIVARFKFQTAHDVANVYHFLIASKDVAATVTDLVNAVQNWLDTIWLDIKPDFSGDLDPLDLKIDRVTYNPGLGREVTEENLFLGPWTMANQPSGATESLPLTDAEVVTLRTSRPKSRGRKFYGAVHEGSSVTGGDVASAAYGHMVTAAANHLVSAHASGSPPYPVILTPGLISGYADPPYFFPYNSAVVSRVMGTHRSRRKGVGS